ncbi:MAG: DNA methyltransferase [Nitrospirota bacterium]
MKTTDEIRFDQAKLNVMCKTRSNIFRWRGQFTPEFVEYIINTFAYNVEKTFDPFCGSGTVLLESARLGLSSTGFEINPAAYAMARFISLATLSQPERKRLYDSLQERIESLIGAYHDLPLFQAESNFRDSYKNLIHFAAELLSKIDNRNEKVIALNCLFHAENNGTGALGTKLRRSLEIIRVKLIGLPFAQKPISASLCDARLAHERLRESVDLIVTSPPYINVFNYHQNYRSIMEAMGFNLLKVADSEIGSNRKNRGNRFRTVVQYALDMESALDSFARSLRRNGLLVLVVGRESRVRGIPFSNSAILLQIAEELGVYEKLATPERVFTNRFGMSIKEDILVLKMCGSSPHVGNARNIANLYLQKALVSAQGDIAEDINDALAQIMTIHPSPIFNKKEII